MDEEIKKPSIKSVLSWILVFAIIFAAGYFTCVKVHEKDVEHWNRGVEYSSHNIQLRWLSEEFPEDPAEIEFSKWVRLYRDLAITEATLYGMGSNYKINYESERGLRLDIEAVMDMVEEIIKTGEATKEQVAQYNELARRIAAGYNESEVFFEKIFY